MLLHDFIEYPEVLDIPGQPIHLGRNDHIDFVLLDMFEKLIKSRAVGATAGTEVFKRGNIFPAIRLLAGDVRLADFLLAFQRRILDAPVLIFSR